MTFIQGYTTPFGHGQLHEILYRSELAAIYELWSEHRVWLCVHCEIVNCDIGELVI